MTTSPNKQREALAQALEDAINEHIKGLTSAEVIGIIESLKIYKRMMAEELEAASEKACRVRAAKRAEKLKEEREEWLAGFR